MELSLAPIDEEIREGKRDAADGETAEFKEPGMMNEVDEQFEGTGDPGLQLAIDEPEGVVEEDLRGDDEAEPAPSDSSRIGEMDREESSADPDQTFQSFELDDSMNRAMFEETIQEDMPGSNDRGQGYDETLPGVSALQMAADIGSQDQPTPVAAETVFTAGTTTRKGSPGVKWVLIGSTMVMVVAALVWYYYTVTPINRPPPSPMVARGIESVTTAEIPDARTPRPIQSGTLSRSAEPDAVAAESGPGRATKDRDVPVSGTITAEKPATKALADSESKASADTEPRATSVEPRSGEEVGEEIASAPMEETAEETTGDSSEETGATARRASSATVPAERLEPPPSLIKISRSKAPARRGLMLDEAYRSYKTGDYRAAMENYEKVLQQYPDNRDALLGLAAVSLKRNDEERALRIYRRILQLNPRDDLVRAALINLSKTTDRKRAETTVKLMLQDNPDEAYLHFALGNIYASQSHWPDAQKAYFDAFRLDSTNADYAMNLAVGLDRMGKTRPALDYYRTALELAGEGGAGFDPEALRKRISILEGTEQP